MNPVFKRVSSGFQIEGVVEITRDKSGSLTHKLLKKQAEHSYINLYLS